MSTVSISLRSPSIQQPHRRQLPKPQPLFRQTAEKTPPCCIKTMEPVSFWAGKKATKKMKKSGENLCMHACMHATLHPPVFIVFIPFFRSGSGKTTLLHSILKAASTLNAPKPLNKIVLVNTRLADYVQFKEKITLIHDFSEMNVNYRDSIYVVEDIIHLEKKFEILLRKCLNYWAHHHTQKYFFVSHGIYKTCIWGMLNFFHFIIFTQDSANLPILRQVLNYFKLPKKTVENLCQQFSSILKAAENLPRPRHSCFYFDVKKQRLYYTTNIFNPEHGSPLTDPYFDETPPSLASGSEREAGALSKPFFSWPSLSTTKTLTDPSLKKDEPLLKQFESFVQHLSPPSLRAQAKSLFSILLQSLPHQFIQFNDLSFKFMTRRGEAVLISLVDYIITLLSPDLDKVPIELQVLHQYLKRVCRLPALFVKNKHLK